MNPFRSACLASLLLVVMLLTTACPQSPVLTPPRPVIVCLGKLGFALAQLYFNETASIADAVDAAPACINAAFALFDHPQAQDSTEVHLSHSSTDSTVDVLLTSSIIANCTASPVIGWYEYDVPFLMYVGTATVQTTYSDLPSDQDGGDRDLIANTLYQKDHIQQYLVQGNGPSDAIPLTVPAQTQVQLAFTLKLHYTYGLGYVVHNGTAGHTMGWLYDFNFERMGDVTLHSQACA